MPSEEACTSEVGAAGYKGDTACGQEPLFGVNGCSEARMGVGGGSPGSREILRLQQALGELEAHHADTQEAMSVEAGVAREVLRLSMAVAPTLLLDPLVAGEDARASAYQGSSNLGMRGPEALSGYEDDDARSVVSSGSRRSAGAASAALSVASGQSKQSSVSFSAGFDLSSALESTQVPAACPSHCLACLLCVVCFWYVSNELPNAGSVVVLSRIQLILQY